MNTDLFLATLAKYKTLRHVRTNEQLRGYTTCGSHNTFKRWLEDPAKMPIGEWENLMTGLKVPREEQIEILK